MKYQIYLQKDVSVIINALAEGCHVQPSTLIKTMLESNIRNAYKDALTLTGKEDIFNNGRLKDKE